MSDKQLDVSNYKLTTSNKQTQYHRFFTEMKAVLLWSALLALIEAPSPKANSGTLQRGL